MGRINLSQAKPGQVVARDILDSRGNVLLRADSKLSQEALDRLSRRGVAFIEVKQQDEDAPPALSPEQIKARLGELEESLTSQFDGTLNNPLMAALLDATKAYHAEKVR